MLKIIRSIVVHDFQCSCPKNDIGYSTTWDVFKKYFLTDGKQLLVETLFDRLLQFFNKKAESMFLSKLQYTQFSRFV